MKRPFAVTGMSLAVAVAVASYFPEKVGMIAALCLIVLSLVCFFGKKLPRALPVCLLCCATGIFLYYGVLWFSYRPYDAFLSRDCELHGQIVSDAEPSYGNFRYVIAVDHVDGEEMSFRVRLTTDDDSFSRYEVVTFHTTLKQPSKVSGLHSQPQNTLYAQKIVYTVYAEGDGILSEGMGKRPFLAVFADAANLLKDRLAALLKEEAPVAQAIMLGDKSELSLTERDDFSRIGVSHLFAVSGLHLSTLLGFFLFLGKKLSRFRIPVYLGGMVLVLSFMAVTGFSYSVCRAGIMSLIMLLGALLFREPDPFNSLGFSVIVLMLFNPLCALDVGFQMSVCATMGLVTLGPRVLRSSKHGLFGRIRNSFLITFCATVFLLPIYSAVFGRISVLMPLANLLLVPAGSAVLVLSLIAVFAFEIPFAGTYLSLLPAYVCRWIIRLMRLVCTVLAKPTWQSIGVTSTLSRLLIAFILLVILLWLHKHISGKEAAVSCLSVTLVALLCGIVFFQNRTVVRMWGTKSSVCTVIHADGMSFPFAVEGYYADSIAEQYACEDNCFHTLDEPPQQVNGWMLTSIPNENGETAFVILSCKDTRILLADRPDRTAADALLKRNETYQIVFFRAGRDCNTAFLTGRKIADTVFYCDAYYDVPVTQDKLKLLGYRVTDLTDTPGAGLILSDDGGCRVL